MTIEQDLERAPSAGTCPIPKDRRTPLDIPAGYREMLESGQLQKALCPSGVEAWMVTGYDDLREALGKNEELGNQFGPMGHMEEFSKQLARTDPNENPGHFIRLDAPRHAEVRRRVAGHLGPRPMKQTEPMIQEIVDGLLDELAAGPGTADFVEGFANLISSRTISYVMGVPEEDRESFQHFIHVTEDSSATPDQVNEARAGLRTHLRAMVEARMEDPQDDLISQIIVSDSKASEGSLGAHHLSELMRLVLSAGHMTTANQISLSILLLLQHPDQMQLLAEQPELLDQAGEELIRYISLVHWGVPRYVRETTTIGEQTVDAGDFVINLLSAGNRDARKFDDPNSLNILRPRSENPHLAFGHGPHQCIGQHMARLELKVALRSVLARVKGLRLAVDPSELSFKQNEFVYGAEALPLTWDEILPR